MFAVPMYDSEIGVCGAIVGYAGPFPTIEHASAFQSAYNKFYSNRNGYYTTAQTPVLHSHDVKCTYDTSVDGVDYLISENKLSQSIDMPHKSGGWSPPYSKLFIANKMGVLLGKGMRWYTCEEHRHQRYSTDSTLVAAIITNDSEAFQKAYKEICGKDATWGSKNFDKLTVVWVPKGLKFCIGWDAVSKSEEIQEYVERECIVAKEDSQ